MKPAPNKSRFLEELYSTYRDRLCSWLRQRYGAGPPDPEDIAQAAFEKIAALDDIENIRDPRAFLFTIAARTAISDVRWLARTRNYINKELNNLDVQVEEISPERVYMAREQFDAVATMFGNLTDKQREIIVRSRLHGQTYEQISAETGWSIAAISRQLKAALLTIHKANHSDMNPPQPEKDSRAEP